MSSFVTVSFELSLSHIHVSHTSLIFLFLIEKKTFSANRQFCVAPNSWDRNLRGANTIIFGAPNSFGKWKAKILLRQKFGYNNRSWLDSAFLQYTAAIVRLHSSWCFRSHELSAPKLRPPSRTKIRRLLLLRYGNFVASFVLLTSVWDGICR